MKRLIIVLIVVLIIAVLPISIADADASSECNNKYELALNGDEREDAKQAKLDILASCKTMVNACGIYVEDAEYNNGKLTLKKGGELTEYQMSKLNTGTKITTQNDIVVIPGGVQINSNAEYTHGNPPSLKINEGGIAKIPEIFNGKIDMESGAELWIDDYTIIEAKTNVDFTNGIITSNNGRKLKIATTKIDQTIIANEDGTFTVNNAKIDSEKEIEMTGFGAFKVVGGPNIIGIMDGNALKITADGQYFINDQKYFTVKSGELSNVKISLNQQNAQISFDNNIPAGTSLEIPSNDKSTSKYGNIIGSEGSIILGPDGNYIKGNIKFENININQMDYRYSNKNDDSIETLSAITITKTDQTSNDFEIFTGIKMDAQKLSGNNNNLLEFTYMQKETSLKNFNCADETGTCLTDTNTGVGISYKKQNTGGTNKVSVFIIRNNEKATIINSQLAEISQIKDGKKFHSEEDSGVELVLNNGKPESAEKISNLPLIITECTGTCNAESRQVLLKAEVSEGKVIFGNKPESDEANTIYLGDDNKIDVIGITEAKITQGGLLNKVTEIKNGETTRTLMTERGQVENPDNSLDGFNNPITIKRMDPFDSGAGGSLDPEEDLIKSFMYGTIGTDIILGRDEAERLVNNLKANNKITYEMNGDLTLNKLPRQIVYDALNYDPINGFNAKLEVNREYGNTNVGTELEKSTIARKNMLSKLTNIPIDGIVTRESNINTQTAQTITVAGKPLKVEPNQQITMNSNNGIMGPSIVAYTTSDGVVFMRFNQEPIKQSSLKELKEFSQKFQINKVTQEQYPPDNPIKLEKYK
jgi:hypothetical protein